MLKFKFGIKFYIVLVVVVFGFASCKTTRELPTVVAKPIGTNKLLKKVEQNAFVYEDFTIKRINCNFSDNQSKTTFKIRLKAQRDKKILVSISKLNIPVGQVLLTNDSVKYVNYIDRNYFIDDYSYLSSILNIDLDFATIQSIISNNAFSYRNDSKNRDFKTFDSLIEDGLYVLQSEKQRKLYKMDEKGNAQKVERRLRRLHDEALILQKMYFNPFNFALSKLIINDKSNLRQMQMAFNDFTKVDKKDYPGAINMNFDSPESNVELKIRMSGFSTEKISSMSFKIPSKYKQLLLK